MKFLIVLMTNLLMIGACAAQSKLPAAMPEKLTIYLNESGGMMRAYKKVTIDAGVLEFEELKGGRQNPERWTAQVSRDDLEKLYRAFVDNRFDRIENDERRGIVYDAGSESISISIDKLKSFGVTSGKNSPLSGVNLERYQNVRRALDDLIAKYRNGDQTLCEADDFLQGTWRAEGQNGKLSWFLEWTFERGAFRQSGYPPLFQEGKYRVAGVAGRQVTLELFDQKGNFGDAPRRLQITIDEAADRLTISGTGGFARK